MNWARVITVGLGLLAASAGATPPEQEPAGGPGAVGAAAPAVAGGLIFTAPGEEARTDELVGELLLDPTAREALRTDSDGLIEERMPDGSVRVDLLGRFQNVVVARLARDGSLHLDHVAQPVAGPASSAAGPACEDGRGADGEVQP
jgi:hypothetical protein